MIHRSRIQINRNPIIELSRLEELYLTSAVILLGSLAFACSDGNGDDIANTGDANAATSAGKSPKTATVRCSVPRT